MDQKTELDHSIENLLDLDGEVMEADYELQYYAHFDVKRVELSEGRPHGVKYSLTLHDKHNERLLGFDNAHAIKEETTGGFIRHRLVKKYDHKHKFKDIAVVMAYDYTTAEQLMIDFWAYVDEAIELDTKRNKR